MRAWVVVAVCGCGRIGFDAVAPAGVDAPPPPVCPAFAIFCDSFESGDVSKWDSTSTVQGNVTPTSAPVHSGSFALDCIGEPDPSNAVAALNLAINPKATGTLAMREWAYAPQPLVNFDGIMQLRNAPDKFVIVVGDELGAWDATEDSSAGGLIDHHTVIPARENVWMCVELDYVFDPTPTIELYVDDSQILAVPADDTSPSFDAVQAGIGRADEAGEHVVIDDIVIATQHIGCR